MYLSWSDIYSSFLFHCWELLTHVHLMELFSMGLRYQFISTPPVILLITRGTQLFLLEEMFEVDRRNGRGHLYFVVDIILVKHLVNQQWVQTGWLVPSWAELTTIFPSMTALFVFGQKWERPERHSSPSSGTMKLKELQCKRTFTIGPNTCQLATVTGYRPPLPGKRPGNQ